MIKKNYILCDLCGSSEHKLLFDAKDRLHGYEGLFSYVICVRCGLIYMNPQVSPDDIGTFYPDCYAPHLSKRSESNKSGSFFESKMKRSRFSSIWTSMDEQNRLLDVGCGIGKFLYEIKNIVGCEVYGVDASSVAVNMAKNNHGLDIFLGTILDASFPDRYFDLITGWSYLEHVNNPSEVMQQLFNLLKSGGSCIISTCNFDSFNAKLFKDKWYHLDCPRHLYIFTPKTITRLMKKNGFVVKKIIYERASKGLLGSLQYYFYGNNFGKKHQNKVRRSSLAKAVVSPLTRIIALLKMADIMVVHAMKE